MLRTVRYSCGSKAGGTDSPPSRDTDSRGAGVERDGDGCVSSCMTAVVCGALQPPQLRLLIHAAEPGPLSAFVRLDEVRDGDDTETGRG